MSRLMRLQLLTVAGGFLILSACSGGSSSAVDGATVAADSSTPSPIGAEGGTVSTPEGHGVSVPAGAVSTAVDITVAEAPSAAAPPAKSGTVVGPVVAFGPEGQQFTSPVTVTVTFDPAKLPAGKTAANVVIFTAPAGSTAYTSLTTTMVDATHVSAKVSHFSNFAPLVPAPAGVACIADRDCNFGQHCTNGICGE